MERKVLTEILVEILGVDASEIKDETTFLTDLGADSLDIFQIVARLQEELNITFDVNKVEKVQTVQEALKLIEQTKKQ